MTTVPLIVAEAIAQGGPLRLGMFDAWLDNGHDIHGLSADDFREKQRIAEERASHE